VDADKVEEGQKVEQGQKVEEAEKPKAPASWVHHQNLEGV